MIKTKKYIDECHKDDFVAQISFLGGDDCENPEETDVQLHLFRVKENTNNSICFQKNTEPTDLFSEAKSTSDIIKIWSKEFGHISMPEAAWHGINLIEFIENNLIVALSNKVMCLNLKDGKVEWETEQANKFISNILVSEDNERIIAQNDDVDGSLSAIDITGKEIWRNTDASITLVYYKDGDLRCRTWEDNYYKINDRTGKLTPIPAIFG